MGPTLKLCFEVLLKFYARTEDLGAFYINLCVVHGVLSFTASLGNIMLIFALQKASSIPRTSRILMQSLALTDLSVGLLGHPLYIVVIAGIRHNYGCEHIHVTLMVFFILSSSLVVVSFQIVTFIGVDRFLAITLHLRYNELVTPKRLIILVASMWIFTLSVVFIGVFYYFQVGEVVLLVGGYASVLLLGVIYVKVYLVARRHQASIDSQAQATSNINLARNRNLAIKTLYVFVVFELCFLPYLITLTFLLISGPSVVLQRTVQLVTAIMMLNSSLNPVVFGWKMREIRQIIKNRVKTLLCR